MNYYIFLCLVLAESNIDRPIAYNQIDDNNELTVPANQSTGYNLNSQKESNQPLIVGGVLAALGDVPWIVALQVNAPDGSSRCGGSIVTKRTILTAAHCVNESKPEDVIVRAGSLDYYQGKEYLVERIIFPADYNKPTPHNNDIALLILKTGIELNGNTITEVKLPKKETPADTAVMAAGWGLIRQNPQEAPSKLHKVQIKIQERSYCQSIYQHYFTDNMICAGIPGEGKTTCSGDSGGPLTRVSDKVQVGISSFGTQICGKPRVFVRVVKYRDWIDMNKV